MNTQMTTGRVEHYTMGGKALVPGESLLRLRESTAFLDDTETLRTRMQEDGYFFLRGFFDRPLIMKARHQILTFLAENGILKEGALLEEGIVASGKQPSGFPHEIVRQFDALLDVVNSPRIMDFFERFLGQPALTLDHKWLRAAGPGKNIGAHCDIVFMGAGTRKLYSVWTALGDIPLEMGTLAVCLGSHKHEKLKSTYGAADAHQDLCEGIFDTEPHAVSRALGCTWASTEFQMGDVVVFDMYLMHGSLDNQTDRIRLSSDTRYQAASEPVDERHMGETPDAFPKYQGKKTVAEARREWGI